MNHSYQDRTLDPLPLSLPPQDLTIHLLILILMLVVIGCWGTMVWTTVETYRESPPLPNAFVTESNETVMSYTDIVNGKAAFQKADLMDYGSEMRVIRLFLSQIVFKIT